MNYVLRKINEKGQEEWLTKIKDLENELETNQKRLEEEIYQNKEFVGQMNNFEEDKEQFILKIQELEEDNIRLMKYEFFI
jgi:hypothetical protein